MASRRSLAHHRSWVFIATVGNAVAVLADAVGELDDAAARIQYAYHTADVRGIEDALTTVQKIQLPASLPGMKEYYTAFGRWKLAELHAAAAVIGTRDSRGHAAKAASACVEAAEHATQIDSRMGEAYAIAAICSSLGGRLPDTAAFSSCAKHKLLRTALELDAANPRIRFIESQCLSQTEKMPSTASIARARAVVAAFEAAPPSEPARPDWGHAEALVALGKLERARGNHVAARDVIERALVIAPDYREAQLMLQQGSATR